MTTIRWLRPDDPPDALPPAEQALREPNGLLAAGGSLSPAWLLGSYARGIFPWYETGQPILWWSPDPRCVLPPDEVRVSRSLAKTMRGSSLRVRCDTSFDAVVAGCAAPRRYTSQTWITDAMANAYSELHRLGWAHSFETWAGDRLVGGLYGVAIGRVFFGESMFAAERDASKLAFVAFARYLTARGFALIDCQLPSGHLESLGAREIPRQDFIGRLRELTEPPGRPANWTADFAALSATPAVAD